MLINGLKRLKAKTSTLTMIFGLSLLTLAAISSPLFQNLESKRQHFDKTRDHFKAALHESRLLLATSIKNLAMDGDFLNQLEAHVPHTLQKTLASQLKYGSLDQLTLFDQDCQIIVKASHKKLPSSCHQQESQTWEKSDAEPVWAYTQKISLVSGKTSYLTGYLSLDNDWLHLHPDLQSSLTPPTAQLQNRSQMGASFLLYVDTSSKEQDYAASLTSSDWQLRLMPQRLSSSEPMSNPLSFPLILLGIMMMYISARQLKKEKNMELEALQIFWQWGKSQQNQDFKLIDKKTSEQLIVEIQSLHKERLDSKEQTIRSLQSLIQEREKSQHELESKMKVLEQKFCHYSLNNTLQLSIATQGLRLLSKLDDIEESLMDMDSLIGGGLIKEGREFNELIQTWKQGIEVFGSRKFIRSLYETSADQESSILDEHLEFLFSRSGAMIDQSLHLSTQFQHLLQEKKWASSVLSLWYSLALTPKSENEWESHDLNFMFNKALELFSLQHNRTLHELIPVEFPLNADLPASPNTGVWVAAFFHILSAMKDHKTAKPGELSFIIKQRMRGQHHMLTISLSHKQGLLAFTKNESHFQHLETASLLLNAYHISCFALPAVEGSFTIALSWDQELSLGNESKIKALPRSSQAPRELHA